MSERARIHHAEKLMITNTAQAFFEGALRRFDGHANTPNSEAAQAARQELHELLDDLLAAKVAQVDAMKRALR